MTLSKSEHVLRIFLWHKYHFKLWADKSHSPCCRRRDSVWQNKTWCPKLEDQEAFAPSLDQGYYCSERKGSKTILITVIWRWTTLRNNVWQQTLTEKPNFLNSLAQSERRLSWLRLFSLSVSNAACRKPWRMSLCSWSDRGKRPIKRWMFTTEWVFTIFQTNKN